MMKNILSQEFSRLFQVEIFNKPSNAICFSVPFIPGYLKISYSNKIKYTNICDFYQILEYYKIENPESPGSRKKNEFIKRRLLFKKLQVSAHSFFSIDDRGLTSTRQMRQFNTKKLY